MDDRHAPQEQPTPQALLGYLNFSDGRPDPRWQRQLEAYARSAQNGDSMDVLLVDLRASLHQLHASRSAAFRDITQAESVLAIAAAVLPAYRRHHADLLAHLEDADIFNAFFLARVLEAVLQTRNASAMDEPARDEDVPSPRVRAVLAALNDFVGHRPIATLETRPQGEPYEHERHRPLPLYIRGAGVVSGRYHDVVEKALEILRDTDSAILAEACFHFDRLEELAVDLRAYDHGHPVNRRPNYVFGEWDPHQIDNSGRYRRYVIRKITLDALMDRVENAADLAAAERFFEGAAVLAGTILMAAGVSGWGPSAHDSSTTLATLLPRIARYRDAFYQQLLARTATAHAERLRQELQSTRQPFGSARQHLNAYLARHRATQLQQRYLALLIAEMGYPQASQTEARRIPAVSVRMLSDILARLAVGQVECDQGKLLQAAARLPQIENLLHRGIACGAFADPWNILGFQGMFPLSPAREDSIRDPRLDELVQVVEHTFTLCARLMSEAAAADDVALVERLDAGMERLARWWDPFATYEVSDLRRVHGGEAASSARNVAAALGAWRQRGATTSDLGFWRDRLDAFRSPKAFALVVEALLQKGDHRAALGLLASWLGQTDQVPLEDAGHSFHNLALRWMLTLQPLSMLDSGSGDEDETESKIKNQKSKINDIPDLIRKFFDYLEANADEYWEPPSLQTQRDEEREDAEEDPFEAAYEGVTYRDSTAGDDGAVSDGATTEGFDLEEESDRLEKRLRFLSTLARLWQVAARILAGSGASSLRERLEGWLRTARRNRQRLLELLDAVHNHTLPEPSGDYDSLVEFDRRRVLKEQLVYTTIATCLDDSLAVGALRGALGADAQRSDPDAPAWEGEAIRLERALFASDAAAARAALGRFTQQFLTEPLLFSPLSEGPGGGEPRTILRVRIAQAVLRALLSNLPRLGLLRETYELLRTARAMEQAQPTRGRGVTEFNHFFQSAYQAVVETVVRSSLGWKDAAGDDAYIVDVLERLTAPFLALWMEHSRTLQLSVLEGVTQEAEWRALTSFVQRYGSDLFHARFLTLANLRGIMHRGAGAYLDYLHDNPDPLHPVRLIDELDRGISRADAIRRLEVVLQAVIENYEEYKDYNTTTTQSDYGENLHVLLDFLRLKVRYERHAWHFRPLVLAHEMLARHGRASTALHWQESLTQFTRDLALQHLDELARLERQHGVRLGTISDRLSERFVKPLALDRLCALIDPCLRQAREEEDEAARPAFQRLQAELRTYTTSPTGVGLDVPAWLRRLETEVHRVRANRTTVAVLAENFFRIPRRAVSHEDVQRQLREWERPALPS